jgi:hypothetical protein
VKKSKPEAPRIFATLRQVGNGSARGGAFCRTLTQG